MIPGPFVCAPYLPGGSPVKQSISLRHGGYEPRRKVLRQPVERGILLFEKALRIRRDFILVSKQEIACVIEHFLRRRLGQRDLAFHGHEHGCRAPARGIKEDRSGLQAENFPLQNSVAARGIRSDLVLCPGKEFMHRRRSQFLFYAVACGFIFESRNSDHVDTFGQRVASPRNMIATTRDPRGGGKARNGNPVRPSAQGNNFSASLTAFHAGNRMLSAAPHSHQVPGCAGSCSGDLT